jgi:hypothetical protein
MFSLSYYSKFPVKKLTLYSYLYCLNCTCLSVLSNNVFSPSEPPLSRSPPLFRLGSAKVDILFLFPNLFQLFFRKIDRFFSNHRLKCTPVLICIFSHKLCKKKFQNNSLCCHVKILFIYRIALEYYFIPLAEISKKQNFQDKSWLPIKL